MGIYMDLFKQIGRGEAKSTMIDLSIPISTDLQLIRSGDINGNGKTMDKPTWGTY